MRRDEEGAQRLDAPVYGGGFCFPGFTLKKGRASCRLGLVWVGFGFWLIYSQESSLLLLVL